MVERPGAPYRSANAGELSPEVAGRVDVKQFYSAGLRFKNMEPAPLSGFRDMAGSFDLGRVRGRVQEVLTASGAISAVFAAAGEATLWEHTAALVPVAVACRDLVATTGLHSLRVQVLVGAAWVDFGQPVSVGTASRNLTMAVAPSAGVACSAVRLRATVTGACTISTGQVKVLAETGTQDAPRYSSLRHDSGARYLLSLQVQFMDIYEGDAFVAGVWLPDVTETILPEVSFYAENATIGLAHRDLQTQRIRRGGGSAEWVRDLWPYGDMPEVDMGGVYTKLDDEWEITLKRAHDVETYVSFIVNGEETPGIPLVNSSDVPVVFESGLVDRTLTAANMQAAIEALPSLGSGVTVTLSTYSSASRRITVTFGGDLSGTEYQLAATVTNTADVSALATHVQIGKTNYEPMCSATRGWPGVFGFAQDRLVYGDIREVPPAILFSQAGEYFKVNIKATGAAAPRLDKLRAGQVMERVLAFAEASYFLVFTTLAVHFAANRTVSATEPLNYVQASDKGIVVACDPVKLENKVYYMGVNPKGDPPTGHQLLSLAYSEIETSFDAVPEHIFAMHLVDGIVRMKGQSSAARAEASKLWLMRDDGRLIAANIIKSQDVLGFCEWICADGGAIEEIHVDAGNDVRMAVRRGGVLRHERQDRASLFQSTVSRTPDLSGGVTGLEYLEGRAVWAEVDGYVLGPFTVDGGAIALGDAYAGPALVGLWQPPLWESMPRVLITRNDEVVKRPGRIHSATLELLDTTSVAVGANGEPPENLPLQVTGDAVTQAVPGKTMVAQRSGMMGFKTGTTLVVTQTRPGRLQVRDILIKERL